ncbi:aurora kinase B-like [Cylas formicarius]|uniref:aurora kinase B-like n=1 Tax=Cylas formicarius TaxID=197179 RepID=UPI002958753A|nr:aurora kinase B-like [Cylas formicarius]
MSSTSKSIDKLVDKHLQKLKIPDGFEKPTRELVKNMMQHPAYNNPSYNWSLNDFELGKRLGRGKFGRVFIAREKRTGYLVALKTLVKKEIVKGRVERLTMREIEIQSHLKHPNILQLLAWFHDSHRIYIILEFAGKGELYRHLKSSPGGRFSESISAKYIYQVADALEYCHQNQVIHRDIKPENLLLTITNDVKLADFGWSVHSPSMHRNTLCGTLDYLPPEMVDGKDYRHHVDNWCLGILCYEFLHGYPPFEGKDQEDTHQRIKSGNLKFADFISDGAHNLITNLVVLKGEKRMSLVKVMKHPWVINHKKEAKGN